jgi:glucose-6-phosphate 1-dehydrogenase
VVRSTTGLGALRDVVQNHALQMMALVAMEPAACAIGDELRAKKCDVPGCAQC